MGRKRSSNSAEDENKIRKKIAKLQEKLNNKTQIRRRVFIESSSEDESNIVEYISTDAEVHETLQSPQDEVLALTQDEDVAATADVGITPVAANVTEGTATDAVDDELDSDILELLGDPPKAEIAFGPAVHKDIAARWEEILKKGLSKEVKQKILELYSIPENCSTLMAPNLNPEAKAALPDVSIKRDAAISTKQQQMGAALGALAIAMDRIIKGDTKHNILKPFSDACRILCDNHFMETRIRRNFVISTVNTSLKEALIDAQRDKYLFGENLGEKVKTAKCIQKSGEELKSKQKTPFNKNAFIKKNTNNLNYQHRKTFSRGATQSARGGSTQRPMTRSNTRQQLDQAPRTSTRRDPSPPRRSARR